MAKKQSKPKGWRKFDRLAKQLAHVPKEAVDERIEADKQRRKRRRKKK